MNEFMNNENKMEKCVQNNEILVGISFIGTFARSSRTHLEALLFFIDQ